MRPPHPLSPADNPAITLLGLALCARHCFLHFINANSPNSTAYRWDHYYLHLRDEETESQGSGVPGEGYTAAERCIEDYEPAGPVAGSCTEPLHQRQSPLFPHRPFCLLPTRPCCPHHYSPRSSLPQLSSVPDPGPRDSARPNSVQPKQDHVPRGP